MAKQTDIMPPQGKPRIVRMPKRSAEWLLKNTLRTRRDSSARVAIEKADRTAAPNILTGWSAWKVVTYNKDNKHKHPVQIFSPDQRLTMDSLVVVNCSCPDYVYTFEVANAEKAGAAFIHRSNGERPGERNPGMRVSLCKHGYLALRHLVRRGGQT